MRRRAESLALAGALLAALSLDAGCAGLGDVNEPTRLNDGGTMGGGDAESPPEPNTPEDAGPGAIDATASPIPPGEGEATDSFAGDVTDLASCRDGADNDGDELFDCADPYCQTYLPSCCVGQTGDSCCESAEVARVPLAGCEGDLSRCDETEGLHFFGGASPSVRARGGEPPSLVVTEDRVDTGFAFAGALDPRAGEVTVSAAIAVPEPDSETALNALGIGFVAADGPLDDLVRVTPRVGLLASRNRDALLLIVGGEVVATEPLTTTDYLDVDVTLGPDGRAQVTVTAAGGTVLDRSLTVADAGAVRAVLWGRVTNPLAERPIRARDVVIRQAACDMPAALSRVPESAIPAPDAPPGDWADVRVGPASVLRAEDGSARVAVQLERGIHIGVGQTDALAFDVPMTVALSETEGEDAAFGEDGVAHPALFAPDDGATELWFTAYSDAGAVIASAPVSASNTVDGTTATLRLAPDASRGIVAVDRPRPFRVDGQTWLLVRERYESEGTDDVEAIGVWELDPSPVRRGELTRRHGGDLFAFDRDELGAVSVIRADDVYRAYFAARNGQRWSIGVAVSDDGVTWYPEPEPVLTRAPGPDALGVRAPSAVVAEGEVLLYYLGTDGGQSRVGVARSPLPG